MIYAIHQKQPFASPYQQAQFGAFSVKETVGNVLANKPLQIGLGTLGFAVAGQYFGGEGIHNMSDWAASKAGSMAGSATEVGFECFTPAMLAKLAATGNISWKDAFICYLASFGAHELGGVELADAITNNGLQGAIDLFSPNADADLITKGNSLASVADIPSLVDPVESTTVDEEPARQFGQKWRHLMHKHHDSIPNVCEHGGLHTADLGSIEHLGDHAGHNHHHGEFSFKGASIHNIITCQLPAWLAHGAENLANRAKAIFRKDTPNQATTVASLPTGWPLGPTEQMTHGAELGDIANVNQSPESDAA